MWKRLAPSRTKKLSTSWVMILRLTGRGKVAHRGLCFFYNSTNLYIARIHNGRNEYCSDSKGNQQTSR